MLACPDRRGSLRARKPPRSPQQAGLRQNAGCEGGARYPGIFATRCPYSRRCHDKYLLTEAFRRSGGSPYGLKLPMKKIVAFARRERFARFAFIYAANLLSSHSRPQINLAILRRGEAAVDQPRRRGRDTMTQRRIYMNVNDIWGCAVGPLMIMALNRARPGIVGPSRRRAGCR